jgi:hypothetical protein
MTGRIEYAALFLAALAVVSLVVLVVDAGRRRLSTPGSPRPLPIRRGLNHRGVVDGATAADAGHRDAPGTPPACRRVPVAAPSWPGPCRPYPRPDDATQVARATPPDLT